MRRPLALVALAVLAGCPHDGGPGSTEGASCSAASGCGSGLVCLAGRCVAEAPRAETCAPPSTVRLVAGAPIQASDPGATCATPIRPPVSGVRVQALGTHAVGTPLEFDVPAGTWSVTIVSQLVPGTAVDSITYLGVPFPNSVVPTDVYAPDGRLFYTDTPADVPSDASRYPDYTSFLGYYGGFTPVSGALTLPNTAAGLDAVRSAGGLPAGRWRLAVNDFGAECLAMERADVAAHRPPSCTGGSTSAEYDVLVITRPGPIASTGTLDLEVYVATPALSAADAPANSHAQRLFGTLGTVLGNAGMCLGTVTFHELPDWAKARWSSLSVDATGPCDPLSQLFTTAVVPSGGVHLFLVDELTESSGSSEFRIIGIDGSIPGPSGVPGTVNGGAVVPLYDFGHGTCTAGSPVDVGRCGDDRIAYVVAHEMGHWLGLYHTTERTGSLFDPLTDTPRCSCNVCAPMVNRPACAENDPSGEPTSMVGGWCDRTDAEDCGGASNLMFWLLDDVRSRGALSPQQGEVVRLNPAVR